MVTQLHLALVMAIDAKLLVLDEPTLGLDILYRKQFYDSLLNDYFDRSRTIVVTTHQVEEIQHVLTDLMFIDRGRIVLDCSMEEFESRYLEVMVHPEQLAAARALKPIHERQVFGRSVLLFDHVDREQARALGEMRTPSIADVFVAVMALAPQAGGQEAKPEANSDEYAIESRLASTVDARQRALQLVGDPAVLLVGAARIVGEPLDLHRAADRRRGRACSASWISTFDLPDAGVQCCWPSTRHAASRYRDAVRHRGNDDHVHRVHRRHLLLPRCAARRTSRSQHPVLEVAAGFGSHHGPLEGCSFRW